MRAQGYQNIGGVFPYLPAIIRKQNRAPDGHLRYPAKLIKRKEVEKMYCAICGQEDVVGFRKVTVGGREHPQYIFLCEVHITKTMDELYKENPELMADRL